MKQGSHSKKGSRLTLGGRPAEVLISSSEIQSRIEELACELDEQYGGHELVVIGVLKGAFVFMSDLVRAMHIPLSCDFLRVSSYDGEKSTGIIRMDFDMTQPIAGKDVLLVEDIVDTGSTLRYLLEHLKGKKPKSLRVVSFLYKEKGTKSRPLIDYLAFEVPDRFVVGYGLDHNGLYRSLPFVGAFGDSPSP